METIEAIKDKYHFLLEEDYIIIEQNSESIMYKQQNSPQIILNFMIDRDRMSLALSTEHILKSNEFGKYDKYFDFFYIIKMLKPEIHFEDIYTDIYLLYLKTNMIKIATLFELKNEKETIDQLKSIIKEYNKKRWIK